MNSATKITYTFNKLYGNFLRDIKGLSDDIKKKVKANYKVVIKSSPEYRTFFWSGFEGHEANIDPSNKDLLDVNVFIDIKLGDILAITGEQNSTMIWNYVYILSALSIIGEGEPEGEAEAVEGDEGEGDGGEGEAGEGDEFYIFDKVIRIFGAAMRGEDTSADLSEIIDDDLKNVLSKLKKVEAGAGAGGEGSAEGGGPEDDILKMFSSLENSKLCNLAKEISQEIDVSNLKIESPQDVMKLMDFSSGNNMLGNIIGKVSSKIQEKISTGDIKHEDLLGEAMNMMGMMQKGGAGGLGSLFNNPMMAEMMKGMKKGNVTPRTDIIKRESTREKLRRKLEERQQQKNK